MKTLIRTMIVFVAVNLVVAGSAFAGNVAGEESSDTVETQPKRADSLQRQAQLGQLLTDLEHTSRTTLPVITSSRNVLLGMPSGSTSAVLVIPSAEITMEEIATITEDMGIMSRIFEKNLEQARINVGSMFIPHTNPFMIAIGRGRQATQGMYLQGYGALFLMKVDFPLSPGPKVEEEKQTEKKEDVDPVWTEMKREIYEPEQPRRRQGKSQVKEYDAEKVENLKTTLVKSLKHAANIRSLKPEESVILTVSGSDALSGVKNVLVEKGQVLMIDEKYKTRVFKGGVPNDELSLPTNIVIRANKSDIDRFANGGIDFDQFQQNTQILTCAYLAGEGGSANPFPNYHGYTTGN